MMNKAVLLLLLLASPVAAQVQSRPTDPPQITAANQPWYQSREAIPFAGDLYYPAGPTVFFDRNTMVRSGYIGSVPLYMDTTIEPYSVVFVPVGRGQMRPYERRRSGSLAGTTASRTPSFPVDATSEAPFLLEAPSAPTQLEPALEPVSTEIGAPMSAVRAEEVAAPISRSREAPMVSLRQPESNDGLWVRFAGGKWVSAGAAVPLRASEFKVIGDYAGFPVFARNNESGIIYLPTRAGLVAPYRIKPTE